MPKFTVNRDFIPVSSYFIEHLMRDANGIFVKVYLYALNLACQGRAVENAEIAKALNILESDVMQAFTHWQVIGAMVEQDDVITFYQGEKRVSTEPHNPVPLSVVQADSQRLAYDTGEIPSAVSQDSSLSEMISLAQEILGKTLSRQEMETLYWFYDGLRFSPEVILMLLEYCVSKNKRHINYIEKVAVTWHEKGISTIEAVDAYLKAEEQKSTYLYSIRKVMGITNRALSQNEEQFLNKWHDHFGMSEEMVALAYEHCILQTAKLSFPYMDKILTRWHQSGIYTIEQAEEDERSFREKSGSSTTAPAEGLDVYHDTYDHEALERLAREKYQQEEE